MVGSVRREHVVDRDLQVQGPLPDDVAGDEARPVLTGILRHPAVAQELDEQALVPDGPCLLAQYVDQHRTSCLVQDFFLSEAPASTRIKDQGVLHEQIIVGETGASAAWTVPVSDP
jgi:hypothetical protein